jgi:putative chitinase
MPITTQQLLQILPNARFVAGVFVPVLNAAMSQYQIVTRVRMAAFIAQVGHESAQLNRLTENLDYSAQALLRCWPGRFDEARASTVAHQPEKIANIAYASRMGNGPVESGDGWRYRGRGLIQVTGKASYRDCGTALKLNLLEQPGQLEEPGNAALSAGWFWAANRLNAQADLGDLKTITLCVNGGLNGYDERLALYGKALKVLM